MKKIKKIICKLIGHVPSASKEVRLSGMTFKSCKCLRCERQLLGLKDGESKWQYTTVN